MLESLGYINKREIFYISTIQYNNWYKYIPKENWLLFAIAGKSEISQLDNFSKKCLDNNVLYICGAGEASSEIDDAFDFEIVNRKIAEKSDDYSETPMTTFHNRIDDALWYAAFTTVHETEIISKVVCINLTHHDFKSEISNLVQRMNSGWIPED